MPVTGLTLARQFSSRNGCTSLIWASKSPEAVPRRATSRQTRPAAACGDRCENLCSSVGLELATCKPDSLTWNDLGARSRSDFVNECQLQWDRERSDLSASDLELALDACRDTRNGLGDLSCEEILALYGPTE